MAGGVSNYAALNARVRIMYGELLGAAQLAELGQSSDLSRLIAGLRQTPYAPYLRSDKGSDFTVRGVIGSAKARLAEAYQSIIQLAPLQARRVLIQLYRRYEINNLKAVLRGISTAAPGESRASVWDRVRTLLFPYGPGTVLPAEAMVESGGLGVAIDMLRSTVYFEALSSGLKRYSAEKSLFPIEVALDLFQWRTLWQETQKLSGPDQFQAARVIGSLVDVTNLLWAIRYRTYQQLAEEEVINYTLPFGYRVHDQDIRAVAAGADLAQLISRLYPGTLEAVQEGAQLDLPRLEVNLQRRVISTCRAEFVGDPFHVGLPLAYLVLHDAEVRDLTLVTEAIASGVQPAAFRSLMLESVGVVA
jgi:vacuolar-type H+-ATPase subunit C/Vma6